MPRTIVGDCRPVAVRSATAVAWSNAPVAGRPCARWNCWSARVDAGDVPVVDLADVVAEPVELVLQEVRDRDDRLGHVAEQLGTRPVGRRRSPRWSCVVPALDEPPPLPHAASATTVTTRTSAIRMRAADDNARLLVTG